MLYTVQGTPAEIGKAYGVRFAPEIQANLSVLIHREGHQPLPRGDRDFSNWVRRQESLLATHWPWLIEEMHGVAQGCGAHDEDIVLLNLRAWQYDLYHCPPSGGCSSMVVTLHDGTKACAGALDDPPQYYCGPVQVTPQQGYAFITFPITGTSWGNRGQNNQGLAVGISSQILPGLRCLPNAINQDLAVRVILQTCATVGEVRDLCQRHPFTMNLVCVDAHGDVFCAHQTTAGLFEIPVPAGWCALTNHISDDAIIHQLSNLGVRERPESATTRLRRGNLLGFCRARNGKCTAEEVKQFVGHYDAGDPGSICNHGTLCITYANPEANAHAFMALQPQHTGGTGQYDYYDLKDCRVSW